MPLDDWTLIGKVIRSVSSTFKPRQNVNPPRAPHRKSSPRVRRGEYLARYVSDCVNCHTQLDSTTFEPIGPEFAGGWEMEPAPLPGVDMAVWFRTPNITPIKGGGLTKFPDRATWIARFKAGRPPASWSPMPWESFAWMSDADLGALYEFLHSLQPIESHNPANDLPQSHRLTPVLSSRCRPRFLHWQGPGLNVYRFAAHAMAVDVQRATGELATNWQRIRRRYKWWQLALFSVGVVAFITVMSALFLPVGERPAHVYPDSTVPAVASADFATALGAVVGAPVERGGSIAVLNNGDEFLPALLQSLNEATSTIHFSVYIWSSGEMSDQVLRVLERKQREGVAVRVLLDGFGSIKISDASSNP